MVEKLEEGQKWVFDNEGENKKNGRPDFVIQKYNNIKIPVEVKCCTRIDEGEEQIIEYQKDYKNCGGILTDAWKWRFYKGDRLLCEICLKQILSPNSNRKLLVRSFLDL